MPIMDGFEACSYILDAYERLNQKKLIYGNS